MATFVAAALMAAALAMPNIIDLVLPTLSALYQSTF